MDNRTELGANRTGMQMSPAHMKKMKEVTGLTQPSSSGDEMAAAMGRALGRTVVYNAVEPAVFRTFGFPGADDLANMFQFKRDFNAQFCAARDLQKARALHPGMLTFDQWLAANAARIPIG